MRKIRIDNSALAFYDNTMLGYDSLSKVFFRININTKMIEVLTDCIINEKEIAFGRPLINNDEIWFEGVYKHELVKINKKGIERYLIDYKNEVPHAFINLIKYKENFFLIPGCNNEILVFNSNTGAKKIINGWKKEFFEKLPEDIKRKKIFGKSRYGSYVKKGNEIYIPLLNYPSILIVDLITYNSYIKEYVHEDATGFLNIFLYEDKQFVLTRTVNEILEMKDDKVINKYKVDMKEGYFGRSVILEEKIYIFGFNTFVFCVFDLRTKTTKYLQFPYEKELKNKIDIGAVVVDDINRKIYVFENILSKLFELEEGSNQFREVDLVMDENSVKKWGEMKFKTDIVNYEESMCNIKDFLTLF